MKRYHFRLGRETLYVTCYGESSVSDARAALVGIYGPMLGNAYNLERTEQL